MATAPSPLPLIDTDLQPLLDQFVGGVNTAIGNLNSDKASLAQQRDDAVANADALQQQLDEITADDTSLAAKLKDSLNQITGYQKQVAQLALPPTAYFGLEKNALFLADKKIPFQWIQPGNAGNTGGPQPGVAHGTCSWTPGAGPNGGTLAKISPAKAFDNFEFYMVLPDPGDDLRRMRWAGDFYCPTPADWNASQQLELQRERIRYGFKYTGAWAFNPKAGLHYWAGAQKWQPFLNPSGSPIMVALNKPTNIAADWLVDPINHTFTPSWINLSGEKIDCNLAPIPAVTAAATSKEDNTEIQGDGNSAAASYSMVLNNHSAEWQ